MKTDTNIAANAERGVQTEDFAERVRGNQAIVEGKNKDYGNKPIAVFQTSDNRHRDFSELGKRVTWVKWAQPTAEALRQACLARSSRVSHVEPRLPAIQITRIEVSNSKFLGPIVLDFNPQYNAIIGSRGTGKSTILEYIRWALCDQPPKSENGGDELADFQKRRQKLIEGTLLPLDAVIDVPFLLNGVALDKTVSREIVERVLKRAPVPGGSIAGLVHLEYAEAGFEKVNNIVARDAF